jgi:protein TonB
MKTNVELSNKAKNSFIYFQLGLIASMLAVLFVLESNFEMQPKKEGKTEKPETYEFSEPISYRIIPQTKAIAETKPLKSQPQFTNQIKETNKEVPKDIEKPIETTPTEPETQTPNQPQTPAPSEVFPPKKTETTVLNVEQLPMFPACKGLKREEQLKCFEEQMRKAVAKNLVYPEDDFENRKQGRALVSFVIDEKGKIVEVKAEDNKNATPEMQKAAERAVKLVSKLTPAKQGDEPVRVKYTIPVAFRMQ